MTVNDIYSQLERDEGLRLKPYRDSVGKLTIGIGRNLDDVGISEMEAHVLLTNDVQKVWDELAVALPWTANIDRVREGVLVNMAFNMGIAGLLKFVNFLAAMQSGRWMDAATAMLDSRWAAQVGPRAARLAAQVRTGEWQ